MHRFPSHILVRKERKTHPEGDFVLNYVVRIAEYTVLKERYIKADSGVEFHWSVPIFHSDARICSVQPGSKMNFTVWRLQKTLRKCKAKNNGTQKKDSHLMGRNLLTLGGCSGTPRLFHV